MFVQELDRPEYLIVERRGFDDKELGIEGEVLEAALAIQQRSHQLQQWLREVYQTGDRSYRVGPPPWLVDQVNAAKQKPQDTEAGSSKKSPGRPKSKGSSSNTSPSE